MPSDDATPHLHPASRPTGFHSCFHPSPSPPPDSVGSSQRSISSASMSISGNQSSEANPAAHQIPFSPRSFDIDLPTTSSGSKSRSTSPDVLVTYGVVGETTTLYSQAASPLSNPRHTPRMVSDIAADGHGLPEVTSRSPLISDEPESPLCSLPFPDEDFLHSNFVQSGIVHLPPPESALETRPTSSAPSTSGQSSRRYRSNSSGSGASREDAPHMTLRFQHYEDENGHHVILGREGKLARCEDEPIRTPGAVQGFGVLIAVEEDMETGNLLVRQVSENSTELLGLSPKYLFDLECFSQALPDNQADVLFDNVQCLSERSMSAEEQAENIHVFMLSGYGEPGSSSSQENNLSQDLQRRRTWTCWCAAHRPQMRAPTNLAAEGSSVYENIIILELEHERDLFNPRYPPDAPASHAGSDISSPSTEPSISPSASNSSGRTLFYQASSYEDGAIAARDDAAPSVGGDLELTAQSAQSERSIKSAWPSAMSPMPPRPSRAHSLPGEDDWIPLAEDVLESTTSRSKPLPALDRVRPSRRLGKDNTDTPDSQRSGSTGQSARSARAERQRRRGTCEVGTMDVLAVMAQINEQLGAAPDLDTFLKVTVGVVKDLTQFHRVLVYQFDEAWNGETVAELVDWTETHDIYKGLHFPATDIPAQARELYALNKVRLLYDRSQPTARLMVRRKEDLENPLDMTHCYLRAMSPIHLKYLENMGVRASMSVSIVAFGKLWGLVACHSYGTHGMRVSFPIRQMLRLLSQSISRNVERLTYAHRLHTRKLARDGAGRISSMPTDKHPGAYFVSNADDLLGLFAADYGVLVIGEAAKILGPSRHGQEILAVAEYLRLKQFDTLQVSQAVTIDYPDLQLDSGLDVIAGLLYVPLSAGGSDFIVFLRKGQPRQVNWAGRPYKSADGALEPRQSFRVWSEIVSGRCKAWAEEHLETAGVLALVYRKFIDVWRQKQGARQTNKLADILLSNASHEVRTPLNHIINYLELAMDGPLDQETMENLKQSHIASKSLLFTLNDLLELTRLESGKETSFNGPFDLLTAIQEATQLYRNEALRRGLTFTLDLVNCPRQVIGDSRKIRTLVANLTANALKFTESGSISVMCRYFDEPSGLGDTGDVAIEIAVADTGCGIPTEKLEGVSREFAQVVSAPFTPRAHSPGLGLGLAVVARMVEQLGGQLRVDSDIGQGSRFSLLLPLTPEKSASGSTGWLSLCAPTSSASVVRSGGLEIDNSVRKRRAPFKSRLLVDPDSPKLRVLVVEDNAINRLILAKRLTLDGHTVVSTTNGQEGLEMIQSDPNFDCILMDLQMPVMDGYEATERIRSLETGRELADRPSHRRNGRIPIFAVSASLFEHQRAKLCALGVDGWILKPIDWMRLCVLFHGIDDPLARERELYSPGCSWEIGGWFSMPETGKAYSS